MKTFEEIYDFSSKADGNGIEDHLLCTATKAELRVFVTHVITLPPNSRVVEIGTYTGRSASVYLQVQKALNLDIHLIDILNWNPEFAASEFWKMIVTSFNDVPFTYHKMPSSLLASTWTRPVDFLYIDGEHELPGVACDFQDWPPFVRLGGILAAHDSQWPGVKACLDRYIKNAGWTLLDEAERMTIWRNENHASHF